MHLDLAPFLVLSILLIVMPGPDTAVVTKNALLGGRRGGVYSAVGVSLGLVIWTVAAVVGLAALLRVIGRGTTFLRKPRVRRALDRFTGIVLVAFGIRLAFEHR